MAGLDLLFDLLGQVVDVLDADAAGVDQLEVAVVVVTSGSRRGRG